jgi:hypothetical protein
MAAKKSQRVIELEERVRGLEAYREAFFCLRKGDKPVKFSSGEDDRRVSAELLGPARASGGVVIVDASVSYATDWLLWARQSPDVYVQDLAWKIERAQTEAIRERMK